MLKPLAADPNQIISISSLNRLVRECLEASFPLTWVGGEISNLTYAASGHVYFSLKDAGAQVRCVMWRNRAQLLGWRLENGQRIEARALVSFYEPRGEFQLNIEAVRHAGQGNLFERFLQLKAKLESEGLFATERKRALPAFPRHLAIVTSPQAAALRDVLSTLQRRAPHLRLTLFPTPVQGDGAAVSIAAAIAQANAGDCEAIILCRGGGSIEDLWAFNEEIVARAIVASAIPVVSGVGHETDFTIADFAADRRAPTPTAAAELVSPEREVLLARLAELQSHLARRMERTLAERQQRIDWIASRLLHPAERIQQRRANLGTLGERLRRSLRYRSDAGQLRLNNLQQRIRIARLKPLQAGDRLTHLRYRLEQQGRWQISQHRTKLNSLASGLRQLDPSAVLARGYALAIGPDGRAVRDAATLTPGSSLKLGFARGSATATVDQVVALPEAD